MIKIDNKLPWPYEYKQLFIEDGGYYEFAHFGWGGFDTQFHGYITGYKESADLLIENAIHSKSIGTLDTVVFPAFFLYLIAGVKSLLDSFELMKKSSKDLTRMLTRMCSWFVPFLFSCGSADEAVVFRLFNCFVGGL